MSKLDAWIDNRIAQNIAIWLFVLIIFTMVVQAENRLMSSLFFILFITPPVYINNLKILPLFFRNESKKGWILFFLNAFFFTFLGVALLSKVFETFELRMVYNVFGAVILILLFGSATKLAKDSFYRRQEEKNAELKLLKAQLNPHFLFNTLNNLYGLSVVKSDKLPSLMLKLSDLLRYSLYDTKEQFVSLEKEVSYIENYISLEKIRLEDRAEITFQTEGNLSSKRIPPMLFIVFVENAFKHLGELKNQKSNVEVKIKVNEKELFFNCINSIGSSMKNQPNTLLEESGIGLQNAKKRLALMYPDRHSLDLSSDTENYIAHLKLTF